MLLLLPSENKTWTYKHEMKRTFSVLPHRGMFACLSQYGKIIAVVSYRCAPALSLVITSSLLSYSSNQHHHSFPFCLQESFLMSWCDDGLIWIFRFFLCFAQFILITATVSKINNTWNWSFSIKMCVFLKGKLFHFKLFWFFCSLFCELHPWHINDMRVCIRYA